MLLHFLGFKLFRIVLQPAEMEGGDGKYAPIASKEPSIEMLLVKPRACSDDVDDDSEYVRLLA